jgi:hypothetical protein
VAAGVGMSPIGPAIDIADGIDNFRHGRIGAGWLSMAFAIPVAGDLGQAIKASSRISKAANAEADAVRVSISRSRYPESAAHIEDAQAAGHPSILTIDRSGAAARRAEAMRGDSRVRGLDRDEYPPAITSEGGGGSSVRPINSSANRGAGSCIGWQCRGFPDGTRINLGVDE